MPLFATCVALIGSMACVTVSTFDADPDPTPLPPDRTDCAEVYNSAFRSETEREWFTTNCSVWGSSTLGVIETPRRQPAPPAAPVAPTQAPPTEVPPTQVPPTEPPAPPPPPQAEAPPSQPGRTHAALRCAASLTRAPQTGRGSSQTASAQRSSRYRAIHLTARASVAVPTSPTSSVPGSSRTAPVTPSLLSIRARTASTVTRFVARAIALAMNVTGTFRTAR